MNVTPRCAAIVLACALSLAGCTAEDPGAAGPVSPGASLLTAPPVPTLPAGDLSDRVLQPADVPRGLVPIQAATGPADIRRIAGFSTNTSGAAAALRTNGFSAAYVVQYADPDSGLVISNVVVRFSTPAGAAADIRSDIRAAAASGAVVEMGTIGDESGVVRQPYPAAAVPSRSGSSATASPTDGAGSPSPSSMGELVTARFRVGALTYLLAVGSRSAVPVDEVRRMANLLVGRAGT